mmetsp:Transcript_11344/g.31600  ORF Transcript_11344/g.31600 Transcript_11344/m.31600 type:complete len:219 (-) Transcript_11344:67-723(-)
MKTHTHTHKKYKGNKLARLKHTLGSLHGQRLVEEELHLRSLGGPVPPGAGALRVALQAQRALPDVDPDLLGQPAELPVGLPEDLPLLGVQPELQGRGRGRARGALALGLALALALALLVSLGIVGVVAHDLRLQAVDDRPAELLHDERGSLLRLDPHHRAAELALLLRREHPRARDLAVAGEDGLELLQLHRGRQVADPHVRVGGVLPHRLLITHAAS